MNNSLLLSLLMALFVFVGCKSSDDWVELESDVEVEVEAEEGGEEGGEEEVENGIEEDSETPALSLSTSTLSFGADGVATDSNSGVVAITANCDWQATISPSTAQSQWGWVIYPEQGSGSDSLRVFLPASASSRSAVITISVVDSSLSQEVEVVQSSQSDQSDENDESVEDEDIDVDDEDDDIDEDDESKENDEIDEPTPTTSSNIADLMAAQVDSQFTLTNVTVDYIYSDGAYVSSGDTTVLAYDSSLTGQMVVGDMVSLSGTIKEYNGAKQLHSPITIETSAAGDSTIEAIELTETMIGNMYSDYMNQYICIKGATVSNNTITLGTASTTYFNMFGVAEPTISGTVDLYGYLSAYSGVAQIYPTAFANLVETEPVVLDYVITAVEVALDFGVVDLLSSAGSGVAYDELLYVEGDVTLSAVKGTASYIRLWNNGVDLQLRFYSGNIITISSHRAIADVTFEGLYISESYLVEDYDLRSDYQRVYNVIKSTVQTTSITVILAE